MKQPKRVTTRGMRRSKALGADDPRNRREAAERFDPLAEAKAKELEERLKRLENTNGI